MTIVHTLQHCARSAAVVAACAVAQGAFAACYHVYTADGALIYRSTATPVDMAAPFHETLPEIEDGARMVFTLDTFDCAGGSIDQREDRKRLAGARAQRQGESSDARARLRSVPGS